MFVGVSVFCFFFFFFFFFFFLYGAHRDLLRSIRRQRRMCIRDSDSICMDAPGACAVLNKDGVDLAVVHTPAGDASWHVEEIVYVN